MNIFELTGVLVTDEVDVERVFKKYRESKAAVNEKKQQLLDLYFNVGYVTSGLVMMPSGSKDPRDSVGKRLEEREEKIVATIELYLDALEKNVKIDLTIEAWLKEVLEEKEREVIMAMHVGRYQTGKKKDMVTICEEVGYSNSQLYYIYHKAIKKLSDNSPKT